MVQPPRHAVHHGFRTSARHPSGPTAIIIVPENSSAPRYLYLNRSAHISDDIFDPSTNGDSIAHWEGDTLVVDTIGFHGDHGITAIPGGGFRTEKSHLVERYRLLKDGAVLSVTFTWTDPTVFRMPHSYEYPVPPAAGDLRAAAVAAVRSL